MGDDNATEEAPPKPPTPEELAAMDPVELKKAHAKYGDYLKKVGLPFEDEEFDEEETESALKAVKDEPADSND